VLMPNHNGDGRRPRCGSASRGTRRR
jgi:hypothetical protein